MAAHFTLRPMQPEDGPAIQQLMENDPPSPGMSMTTRFVVDPYQAWRTLNPDIEGVLAEAPDGDLLGVGTVSFMTIQFEGRTLPGGFLRNLKVKHEARGQGIAKALAMRRADIVRERYGDDAVILSATNNQNVASQKTMNYWAKQLVSRLVMRPRPFLPELPPMPDGITVRPIDSADFAEAAEKSNAFHAEFNLYAPLSADSLVTQSDDARGIYHYYVAEDARGNLVGGALVCVRTPLMIDEFRNVPPPMRQSPMFPADGILRLGEVEALWFERPEVGHAVWDAIRWTFRDRANSFSIRFDPRGPYRTVFPDEPDGPQMELVTAVSGPTPMDEERLLCMQVRG
jgi:GNAT superfamily N-acetyltransferase